MREDERESLRNRFGHRCGYCGVSEQDVGAELTVDHFRPRSRGGLHEAENWVYCCHACNEFKGDFWEPTAERRILHPLRVDVTKQIAELANGNLVGLTEAGKFHIDKLRLNRPQLVAWRCERQRLTALQTARRQLLQQLQHLGGRLQDLIAQLELELQKRQEP